MPEQFARVGEIELCYETFGAPGDPTVLMIMGLATQMIAWREDLIEMIVERGFRVVRFDNRDVGHSTILRHVPPPTLRELVRRDRRVARYTLHDMAGDARGLLDELGVEAAHVVGASMGGMIAQCLAARHPERVLSLVSIMSNTGSRWTGQPALSVYPLLIRSAPRDREAYAAHAAAMFSSFGGDVTPGDREEVRGQALAAFDRGLHPSGTLRQMGAVVGTGDRTAELGTITAPTLVVHGTRDRLVRPSGGRATAKAIPGARLKMIAGMGHFLPRRVWPQIADGVAETAARAQSPSAAVGAV